MQQNVFKFLDSIIEDYEYFSRSFVTIQADDIKKKIDGEYRDGKYWPAPLIQINPKYKTKKTVRQLVTERLLQSECKDIFKINKADGKCEDLLLYKHQIDAVALAHKKKSYVVTTGTGSGKSLAFFIPVVDAVLKEKKTDPSPRTRAIIIYPMNALANSQKEEIEKFLSGYETDCRPFTVERYTRQESGEERKRIAENPPDILLTNFMMLELLLTRANDTEWLLRCANYRCFLI
jgi:ATP-dependent helicase YprA (DUF1998 family)